MTAVQRLSVEDVMQIRRRMAALDIATHDAFGVTEPLNPARLASAVFRQDTGAGGVYKYTTVPDVGATLFYGVAMAHAFENGNKRTALVCLLVFLDKNKTLLIDAGEEELYELARSVAAHEIPIAPAIERNVDSEVRAIASWIREHIRQGVLGDSALYFKDLQQLLEEQGCTFDRPDKNFIKIRCGARMVRTGYPRANFQIAVNEVKRIRRTLGVDEIHGVDSAGFYSLETKVDEFVNTHRNLMRRLADL